MLATITSLLMLMKFPLSRLIEIKSFLEKSCSDKMMLVDMFLCFLLFFLFRLTLSCLSFD